jgi:hypothetical protein
MSTPIRRQSPGAKCSVDKCAKDAFCKSLCKSHYNKIRAFGDPESGKFKGKYRKAPRINKAGYVVWYDPESIHANRNGVVYGHRHVMGEMLGRALLDSENVHHLNGDRGDNRPENLELWSTSQPPGQRVADKLKWAKEIIEMYDGKKFAA